jgi:UDP-N-acetylmuramyl pentapeptide phosphotransferase/UDP-N-acetylglucosamine-1-phosphate transferase
MLVLVYAISQAPQAGWAATQTVAMLAAGVALLAVFLVVETKAKAPILPLALFRLSGVAGSNAVGFLLGMTGLAAIPVAFALIRGTRKADAIATAQS